MKIMYNDNKVGGNITNSEKYQHYVMPTYDSTWLDKIIQYIGPTIEGSYQSGYFYKGTSSGWQQVNVLIPIDDPAYHYMKLTPSTGDLLQSSDCNLYIQSETVAHLRINSAAQTFTFETGTDYQLITLPSYYDTLDIRPRMASRWYGSLEDTDGTVYNCFCKFVNNAGTVSVKLYVNEAITNKQLSIHFEFWWWVGA